MKNTSMLKSALLAAAVALSLPAPAAQAQEPWRDTGVGAAIAAQGNAALRQIREDARAAVCGAPKPVPKGMTQKRKHRRVTMQVALNERAP